MGQKAAPQTDKADKAETVVVPCCLCGCGHKNNPKSRFQIGHDMKLKGTLSRVQKGNFGPKNCDLGYAAQICRENPSIYTGEERFSKTYSSADIIRLAEIQGHQRQQN